MKPLTVMSGVTALAASCLMVAGAAVADQSLSSQQLTSVVPRVKDVKVFYKNTHGEQAPTAGTGVDYIPSQGICVKSNGKYATLNHLSKRQAWSAQLIGDGEGRGLISIVGQYQSVQQAKNKLAKVKDLFAKCPADVTKGTKHTAQQFGTLARMYKGKAYTTLTTVTDSAGIDFVQYVAIRQTGAQLAFVRFSQQFEGSAPKQTQFRGLVEYESGQVAARYKALA